MVRQEAISIFRARLQQIRQDAEAECDTRRRKSREVGEALTAEWGGFTQLAEIQRRCADMSLTHRLFLLLWEVAQMKHRVVL